MVSASRFSQVADEACQLSLDEQEALIDLLRKRLAQSRRSELVERVEQGRSEFAAGNLKPKSIDGIIGEVIR